MPEFRSMATTVGDPAFAFIEANCAQVEHRDRKVLGVDS
jgi:hypothetical protein